jgi:integrase
MPSRSISYRVGISRPGLNQIVCALRFFYGVTLGEAAVPERIPYAREPRKLPIVLSADEVVRFLETVSSLRSRAALTTAYAAGRRASEVAGLRVEDVDSDRGVILVRHDKGAKDRNVMLSPQLLDRPHRVSPTARMDGPRWLGRRRWSENCRATARGWRFLDQSRVDRRYSS